MPDKHIKWGPRKWKGKDYQRSTIVLLIIVVLLSMFLMSLFRHPLISVVVAMLGVAGLGALLLQEKKIASSPLDDAAVPPIPKAQRHHTIYLISCGRYLGFFPVFYGLLLPVIKQRSTLRKDGIAMPSMWRGKIVLSFSDIACIDRAWTFQRNAYSVQIFLKNGKRYWITSADCNGGTYGMFYVFMSILEQHGGIRLTQAVRKDMQESRRRYAFHASTQRVSYWH